MDTRPHVAGSWHFKSKQAQIFISLEFLVMRHQNFVSYSNGEWREIFKQFCGSCWLSGNWAQNWTFENNSPNTIKRKSFLVPTLNVSSETRELKSSSACAQCIHRGLICKIFLIWQSRCFNAFCSNILLLALFFSLCPKVWLCCSSQLPSTPSRPEG